MLTVDRLCGVYRPVSGTVLSEMSWLDSVRAAAWLHNIELLPR